MSTVAELIDRLKRDFMYPPDDQPTRTTLDGAHNNSVTTINLNIGLLAPEEEDLFGEGQIIEINSEQMLCTAYSSPDITVIRGYGGTTAAAHSDLDIVYLAPAYSRLSMFEAIADEVVSLWPNLYGVETDSVVTSDTAYVEVEDDVIGILRFVWPDSSSSATTIWREGDVQLLTNFTPATSTVAVQFFGVPSGRTGYLTYKKKFSRPTAESDDLVASFAIQAEWEEILVVGAASRLMARADIDRATPEFITDVLAENTFQSGKGAEQRDSLLRYKNYLLIEAKKRQRKEWRERVSMNQVVAGG